MMPGGATDPKSRKEGRPMGEKGGRFGGRGPRWHSCRHLGARAGRRLARIESGQVTARGEFLGGLLRIFRKE